MFSIRPQNWPSNTIPWRIQQIHSLRQKLGKTGITVSWMIDKQFLKKKQILTKNELTRILEVAIVPEQVPYFYE